MQYCTADRMWPDTAQTSEAVDVTPGHAGWPTNLQVWQLQVDLICLYRAVQLQMYLLCQPPTTWLGIRMTSYLGKNGYSCYLEEMLGEFLRNPKRFLKNHRVGHPRKTGHECWYSSRGGVQAAFSFASSSWAHFSLSFVASVFLTTQ